MPFFAANRSVAGLFSRIFPKLAIESLFRTDSRIGHWKLEVGFVLGQE